MCPDHVTDQQIRLLSTLPCRRRQRTAKIFPLVRTYPRQRLPNTQPQGR
jgi:hypothetical protein